MISHNWELIKALFIRPNYTSRWCQGKEAMQCISHTVTHGHRRVTGSHKHSLVFFPGYEMSSELLSSSNLSHMPRLLRPRAEVSSLSSWASQPGGQTLSSSPHSLPAAVASGPCPVLTLSTSSVSWQKHPFEGGRDSWSSPELGPFCTG